MSGTCCVTSWRAYYIDCILMHFRCVPRFVQVQGLKDIFGLVKKIGFALKNKPTQMKMKTMLILFHKELF